MPIEKFSNQANRKVVRNQLPRKFLIKFIAFIRNRYAGMSLEVMLFNIESYLQRSKMTVRKFRVPELNAQLYITQNDIDGKDTWFPILNRGSAYRSGFQAAGYQLAKTYAIPAIKFEEFDVVIDIGANNGILKHYFDYTVCKNIHYFAIEPGLLESYCLKENRKEMQDATLYNLAIGAKSGRQSFSYAPGSGDSSLGEINNAINEYEISVETLEYLIEEWDLSQSGIKLLKLDVEGFELEVLQGAGEKLQLIDFIAVDLGFERGLEQRSTAPEVIHYLLARSFTLENVGNPNSLRFLFKREGVSVATINFVYSHL